MTRDEAIEMVERYDHVKPRKDLERWLEYVGMTEEEFDAIADTLPRPARLGQGRERRLGQGLDPRVRRSAAPSPCDAACARPTSGRTS